MFFLQEEYGVEFDTFNKEDDMKKTFTYVGLTYSVLLLVNIILVILLRGFMPDVRQMLTSNNVSKVLVSILPNWLISYPLLVLLIRRKPMEKPERHDMSFWELVMYVVISFGIVFCANLAGLGVIQVIQKVSGCTFTNPTDELLKDQNAMLLIVMVALIGPILEEIVFRKMLIDTIGRYNAGVAVIMSGVVFGIIHTNISQFFYTFAFGLFLGFIYVKTGRLLYTIIMHVSVNLFFGTMSSILKRFTDTDLGVAIFGLYGMALITVAITGIVLFFVNLKKFKVNDDRDMIKKANAYKIAFTNIGIIFFIVLGLAYTIFNAVLSFTK